MAGTAIHIRLIVAGSSQFMKSKGEALARDQNSKRNLKFKRLEVK